MRFWPRPGGGNRVLAGPGWSRQVLEGLILRDLQCNGRCGQGYYSDGFKAAAASQPFWTVEWVGMKEDC